MAYDFPSAERTGKTKVLVPDEICRNLNIILAKVPRHWMLLFPYNLVCYLFKSTSKKATCSCRTQIYKWALPFFSKPLTRNHHNYVARKHFKQKSHLFHFDPKESTPKSFPVAKLSQEKIYFGPSSSTVLPTDLDVILQLVKSLILYKKNKSCLF